MSTAPFPVDPHLTSIAIAYRNKKLIADEVLPRVPVSKKEFKYWSYDLSEGFTIPDTKVGRKSTPNQVEFTGDELEASTVNYGLDSLIPNEDIENAPDNYDPEGRATEQLTNLIELDREVRAAGLVFNPATYGANNKVTLAGATMWSDPTSDPVKAILTALDTMVMRPTVGVLGQTVATILRQHPKVVKAMHGNDGDSGIASMAFLAELLELEKIHVGQAFVNTAKKGQGANFARTWGKHAAFLHQDPLADNNGGTTYGFTAQFRDRVAMSKDDEDIGLFGGKKIRSGESVKELVTANDLGYFFQSAIA